MTVLLEEVGGTSRDRFQISKGGPHVKKSGSQMQIVGADGTTLANLSVAEPVAASDAATKNYVDTSGGGGGGFWSRNSTPTPKELSPTTAGDVVLFSAGTSSNPGIGKVGEINTGVYWPAASEIGITLGGTLHTHFKANEITVTGSGGGSNTWRAISASEINMKPSSTSLSPKFHLGIIGTGTTNPAGTEAIFAASGWRAASTSNNRPGIDTILEGGPGTGSSTSRGEVAIKVAVATGSGTTLQTTTEVGRFKRDGSLAVGTTGTTIILPVSSTVTSLRTSSTTAFTLQLGPRGTGATSPALSTTLGSAGWIANSSTNNRVGTDTKIAAGPGTGSSTTGGDVIFITPDAGASGMTPQTSTNKMVLHREGHLAIGPNGTGSFWRNIDTRTYNFYSSLAGRSNLYAGIVGEGSTDSSTETYIGNPGFLSASTLNNRGGGDTVITSGPGTGSSTTRGDIIFRTPNAGASGTAAQTTTVKMTLHREGHVVINDLGSESTPALAIGGETDTGWYMIAANRIALTVLARKAWDLTRSGTTDTVRIGEEGETTNNPHNWDVRVNGWTSASTLTNRIGVGLEWTTGPGTGTGTPGDFEWHTYNVGTTGTTVQSTRRQIMKLTGERNDLQLGDTSTSGRNCKIFIGTTISTFGSMDGPGLVLGDVTTEPTAGASGKGVLFVNGNDLKFMDATGAVSTVAFV